MKQIKIINENMPASQDYRALLDEKFSSIHTAIDLQFTTVKNSLDVIEKQVLKTNGRVNALESNVNNLQKNEAMHMGGQCPQAETFKDIKNEIRAIQDEKNKDVEVQFIRKYPKLSLGIVVASVLIVLFSYTGFMSMKENEKLGTTNVQLNSQILENQKMIKTIELQLKHIEEMQKNQTTKN